MSMQESKLSLNTSLAILWEAVSPFQMRPAVSFSTPHRVSERAMLFIVGCAIAFFDCWSQLRRLRLETFFHFLHFHFHHKCSFSWRRSRCCSTVSLPKQGVYYISSCLQQHSLRIHFESIGSDKPYKHYSQNTYKQNNSFYYGLSKE